MNKIDCSIYKLRPNFEVKHKEQQQYKEVVMRFMASFNDGSSKCS